MCFRILWFLRNKREGYLISCRDASLQPPGVRLRTLPWLAVQFNPRDTVQSKSLLGCCPSEIQFASDFFQLCSKSSVKIRCSWLFVSFDLKNYVIECLLYIDFVLTSFRFKRVYSFWTHCECVIFLHTFRQSAQNNMFISFSLFVTLHTRG